MAPISMDSTLDYKRKEGKRQKLSFDEIDKRREEAEKRREQSIQEMPRLKKEFYIKLAGRLVGIILKTEYATIAEHVKSGTIPGSQIRNYITSEKFLSELGEFHNTHQKIILEILKEKNMSPIGHQKYIPQKKEIADFFRSEMKKYAIPLGYKYNHEATGGPEFYKRTNTILKEHAYSVALVKTLAAIRSPIKK